jgi:hypothetical protein
MTPGWPRRQAHGAAVVSEQAPKVSLELITAVSRAAKSPVTPEKAW